MKLARTPRPRPRGLELPTTGASGPEAESSSLVPDKMSVRLGRKPVGSHHAAEAL